MNFVFCLLLVGWFRFILIEPFCTKVVLYIVSVNGYLCVQLYRKYILLQIWHRNWRNSEPGLFLLLVYSMDRGQVFSFHFDCENHHLINEILLWIHKDFASIMCHKRPDWLVPGCNGTVPISGILYPLQRNFWTGVGEPHVCEYSPLVTPEHTVRYILSEQWESCSIPYWNFKAGFFIMYNSCLCVIFADIGLNVAKWQCCI